MVALLSWVLWSRRIRLQKPRKDLGVGYNYSGGPALSEVFLLFDFELNSPGRTPKGVLDQVTWKKRPTAFSFIFIIFLTFARVAGEHVPPTKQVKKTYDFTDAFQF